MSAALTATSWQPGSQLLRPWAQIACMAAQASCIVAVCAPVCRLLGPCDVCLRPALEGCSCGLFELRFMATPCFKILLPRFKQPV